jgi:cyclomaltodextrinase
MIQEAILHLPYGAYAYALSSHEARVMLRAKRGDLKKVHLVHADRYRLEDDLEMLEVGYSGSDDLYDYFQTTIHSKTRRVAYRFLLDDGVRRLWYGEKGFAEHGDAAGYFQLAYLATGDLFEIPDWVDEAIVYQIFPDRFCNGNEKNDPDGVRPWGEKPKWDTFFGGDLEGIIEKLPYLQELGVNLIYMTPIFKSPSTHKYDTSDYLTIDPMFGDLATLKRLVSEAHKRGMRVMLDAVFNHCGSQFPYFQDVVEKGEKSRYKDWFHLHSFPVDTEKVNYETFATKVASMPKLRTENPEVREYLLHVAEYWIQEVGIDGWRLDVSNEIDHAFWREFRRVVRKANSQALIIGEVWHDSTPWLLGDQWDGVMNYLFRDAVVEFFAKRTLDAERFDNRLTNTRMRYKEQANRAMFNLLGSHDTHRFLTLCEERVERMRLAVMFQMTYVGIPEVYYGDEVGMLGENDPDCRRCMIWEEAKQNRELFDLHRKLIALRKKHKALQTGTYRTVRADALYNVYGYVRENAEESVYVVLNNGLITAEVTLPAGVTGVDLLTGETYAGTFSLPSMEGVVLLLNGGTV